MDALQVIDIDLFKEHLPEEIVKISKTLQNGGFEVYLVGGAIRDILFYGDMEKAHRVQSDFDFATNAEPTQVIKLFKKERIFTIPTGLKHGTVTVVLNKINFEITTFRLDGIYTDGRRPEEVFFSKSIVEDLSRRDFTINAMAYDVLEKRLIDPFNGMEDIEEKIIRTVGNPVERFMEDGLRPIRACRFAASLNFTIEDDTFNAIPQCLVKVKQVSLERIQDELFKLMKAPTPSIGLEYMRRAGILQIFLPELYEGYGIDQNEFHMFVVYYQKLYACDAAPADKPLVRFAALLHDIAKPRAKKYAIEHGNGNVFYNHEVIGSRMAYRLLKRLKFSNSDIAHITLLIIMHMFYYTEDWTDGAVRRFLRKIDGNMATLDDLLALRNADRIGSGMRSGISTILDRFLERIDIVMSHDAALKVTDLDINGSILIEECDLKPGRIIGEILNYLLELVLDDPSLNKQDTLLTLAQNYLTSDKSENTITVSNTE